MFVDVCVAGRDCVCCLYLRMVGPECRCCLYLPVAGPECRSAADPGVRDDGGAGPALPVSGFP